MRSSKILFSGTVLLSSVLLFLVEPVAARLLLPFFGGSSSLWLTCLVFFQLCLLLGYAYARLVAGSAAVAARLHPILLLLSAAVALLWGLPRTHRMLLLGVSQPLLAAHPFLAVLVELSLSVGLPFLVLSATAPLLQVWWSRLHGEPVPYRLYALSNAASLLALLAYPSLVEPALTLRTQRLLWSLAFVLFACAAIAIARRMHSAHATAPQQISPRSGDGVRSGTRRRLLWLLLPMAATMQLSAVTEHLTANVAAIPLLWIPPLAVYLLTLIAAFQFPSLSRHRGLLLRLLAVMLASLGYMLSRAERSLPIGIAIAFFLLELLVSCLFCHVELVRLRPDDAREATSFYLWFAAGGAAGSFLVGIASPVLFSSNYDLAIAFLLTALLAAAVTWQQGWGPRLLWVTGSVLLLFLLTLLHSAYSRGTLLAARNFYGSLRVTQSARPDGTPMRTLSNGSIQHGTQIFSDELLTVPTTYYAPDSGVGLALRSCCGDGVRNIGVVGLGAGTLAAYGRPGDRMRFYEINPMVLPVAKSLFTYLRDSGAAISFAIGDARQSLAQEQPQHFDVLAIDAFSGDAIPVHLLTAQALALYRRHTTPCGTVAFHVSNQFVDLVPQLTALAESNGMQAREVSSSPDEARGEFRATWVLLTDPAAACTRPAVGVLLSPERLKTRVRPWTDDYSSLLPLMRW